MHANVVLPYLVCPAMRNEAQESPRVYTQARSPPCRASVQAVTLRPVRLKGMPSMPSGRREGMGP